MSGEPLVGVVIATHNRAARLHRALRALDAQTLDRRRFEVVVVDDGSTDDTGRVLERARTDAAGALRVVRRARPGGPGTAREAGWRVSSAPLIAFTDDDCEPRSDWLEAGLAAWAGSPERFVQGRTEPNPEEGDRHGPFSRTMEVTGLDRTFPTCNIFYPRRLLERIGGFDTAAFGRHGGEDTDLAWRAIKAGGRPVYCEEAGVWHAVNQLGPLGLLRVAVRWTDAMRAYARHPELRRAEFVHGVFWKPQHYLLLRALLAVVLPPSRGPWRAWLAGPYVRLMWSRGRVLGGGPLLAPYYLLYDLVEMAGVIRAAIRERTPML